MARMNSLTWGASARSKKRPLPPAAPPTSAKRPKHGPFDVESDSEKDSDSDGGDRYVVDRQIGMAPGQPARIGIGEGHSLGDDTMLRRTSLQRQRSETALKSRAPASKILAPQPGRTLNKDLVIMMMTAKKQGEAAAPSPKQKSPQPTASARTDLRDQFLNAAQAGSSQQNICSPAPRNSHLSSQRGKPRHAAEGKSPDQGERPLQVSRSQIRDTGSIHVANARARTQQTPASAPKSTTPRKTDTVRPQNAANSSSLRNILDKAQAEQRSAVKEQDKIGSGWRKVQAERASWAKPVRNARRPEVGARYGHTLTARKSNAQETEPTSTKGAPDTTGVKLFHSPASENGTVLSAVTSGSPREQAQWSSSKATLAPNATTSVNRTSSAQNGRQSPTKPSAMHGSFPAASHNGPRLSPKAPIERRNDAARLERIDERKRRTPSLSLAPSHSSLTNDEVVMQEAVIPSSVMSIMSQSPYATDEGQTGSYGTWSAQQATHEEPDLMSTSSNSLGRATSRKGLISQKTSMMETTAQPGHSEESIDTDAYRMQSVSANAMDISARRPSTCTLDISATPSVSAESGAQSRMPAAVMISPETPGAHSIPRGGAGKTAPLVSLVIGTDTSQTAALSGTFKCLQPSYNKHVAETNETLATNARLALDTDKELSATKASVPIDLSSYRLDLLEQEKGTQSLVELPIDDTVSEDTPVKSSGPAEAALSRPSDRFYNQSTPSGPSILRVLQPTIPPFGLRDLRPGTEAECVQPQAEATILSPLTTTELSSPKPVAVLVDSTDTQRVPTDLSVPSDTALSPRSSLAVDITLPSHTISPTAEPYFEYSIHQSLCSSSSSTTTTEISAQPFETLDTANAQTEKLFQNAKQQYQVLGMTSKSTITEVLDSGLSLHKGTFTSIEDPRKTLTLKLWVERAEVGAHANHTPSPSTTPPLISRTLYALRLWRLVDAASNSDSDSSSDSEAEDEDNVENAEKEQIRIYCPIPHICTEIHTTLDAANRAAKRVQIELSHQKDPKQPLQRQWQTQNLRELNEKVEGLRREVDEGGDESGSPSLFEYEEGRRRGYWKSVFNGVGFGAEKFEVLVTSVKLSGPRNL